jgi:hypothetical protein
MPTQATIAITPGSGQFLDAVSLVIGLNTVVRETMVIADPSNATYLATVNSSGALNVSDSVIEACITANVLAVSLPTSQITTLTPPSASSIASAIVANPPTVGISGTIPISGTIAATQSGTWTVAITAASGALASGSIAAGAAAAGAFADGSIYVRSNAAATFPVTATIAASQTIAVTNTGTFLVQAEIEGHGGVALDAVLGATKPANVLQVGGNDGTNAYAIPLASGGGSVVTSGTSTVTPSGIFEVAPTGSANTKTNPFFFALTDGTNVITAAVSAWGSAPTGTEVQGVNANLFIAGTIASAAASGIQKVGIVGNAGAAVDAVQGATPPANAVQVSGIAATALPAAATATDTVVPMLDKFGRLVVIPQTVRDLVGVQTTQIASSSAETTIVTQLSGVFCDITGLQITNQTNTPVTVTIKDSTGGTTRKVYDLAAYGGIVVHFSPPLAQATVNNNWTATLSVNTVTVDVNVDYVKNK